MIDNKEVVEHREAIRYVMSTSQGRRFIQTLLEFCGVYHDIPGDQQAVYRGLGRREVGLYLLGEISDVDEDYIFKMMKEAKERQIIKEKEHGEKERKRKHSGDYLSDQLDRGYEHESGGHQYGGSLL